MDLKAYNVNNNMLTGKNILLVKPTINDYLFIKNIWEDEKTMLLVGGIQPLSKERFKNWYDYMFLEKKNENRYFLIMTKDKKECLGEISFHRYDNITKTAELNIKVLFGHRGKGIGKEALTLLIKYFFKEWGGKAMTDIIRDDNMDGYNALKKFGFKEIKNESNEICFELKDKDYENID